MEAVQKEIHRIEEMRELRLSQDSSVGKAGPADIEEIPDEDKNLASTTLDFPEGADDHAGADIMPEGYPPVLPICDETCQL